MKLIKNVLIFSIIISVYFSGINEVPFHPDESEWIATSFVFEAFLTGDFTSALWDDSHWNLTQPQLPRYFIGFGHWIGGIKSSDLNDFWDWNSDYETNL